MELFASDSEDVPGNIASGMGDKCIDRFDSPILRDDARIEVDRLVHGDILCDGYASWRTRFIDLNMALNEFAAWAPAFRPHPTIPYAAKDRRPDDILIQRDRVLIDCHWLYCRKEGLVLDSYADEWGSLFDHAQPFNRSRAEEFAAKNTGNQYRAAEVLCLTERQQLQLRALKTKAVAERVAVYQKGSREGGVRFPSVAAGLSEFLCVRLLGDFSAERRTPLGAGSRFPIFTQHFR